MATETGELKLSTDPFENFRSWLSDALQAMNGAEEANAMTLATASPAGVPTARIVLYKGTARNAQDREGFQLFTNFESKKSQDLQSNPNAALVFYWPVLKRQIRIEGSVVRLSDRESDAYFSSRPRGSRIGAWASPQSQKIKDRAELLERVRKIEMRFQKSGGAEVEIPRPPNWGGWLLLPERVEFWQAGESRLHDRFLFERASDGHWQVARLAP